MSDTVQDIVDAGALAASELGPAVPIAASEVPADASDRLLAATVPQLLQEQERYRSLVLAGAQVVWTSAPTGEMEEDFGTWRAFTGQEQWRGWGWLDAVHPDDRTNVAEAWKRALVEQDKFEIEYRLRATDGRYRRSQARGVPVHNADGSVREWVGMNIDVTDLRAAEEFRKEELEERVRERTVELAAANETLARSNRELEQFARVASHDLQEPLRKIQAFGDRLLVRCGATVDEVGRDYLARMKNAAERMSTLINDLLAFSRVTTKAQPFVPVDLGRIAAEVASDLESRVQQTEGKIEIGSLPTVAADPLQMRQLFQNLLANALKFHRPGVAPVVCVTAETFADDEGRPMCRVSVADNGIGFDEKYLDRIFDVFERLHSRQEYEGTGVGLAIARKIVERHGGAITARSQPDVGSTFLITLPTEHPEQGESP